MDQECQANTTPKSSPVGGAGLAPAISKKRRILPELQATSGGQGTFVTLEDLYGLILELKEQIEDIKFVLTEEEDEHNLILCSRDVAPTPSTSFTTGGAAQSTSSEKLPMGSPPWPTEPLQRRLW